MTLSLDAITRLVFDPKATKNNSRKEMWVSRSLFRPEVKGPAEILLASGMICPESQE